MDNMNYSSTIELKRVSEILLSERSNTTPSPSVTRWVYKDSDESVPSPGSSIIDAMCFPESDIANIVKLRKASPRPVRISSSTPIRPEDLRSESPLSRLEHKTPFLYGNGTELHPIAEQRSLATLRTASFSASDLSSLMHDGPGANPNQGRLRRRQSFSLDDLSHLNSNRTGSGSLKLLDSIPCSPFSTEADTTVYTVDLGAYPHLPPFSPNRVSNWETAGRSSRQHEPSNFLNTRSGHGDIYAHPYLANDQSYARARYPLQYLDPSPLMGPLRGHHRRFGRVGSAVVWPTHSGASSRVSEATDMAPGEERIGAQGVL
ncbi:hypothetical protein BJ170DRAFT_678372 [Xylariales sp. AK1849]|nr:hypothetical protein BJ170DRAFT_678372 [Xylariales sp. AK1849]